MYMMRLFQIRFGFFFLFFIFISGCVCVWVRQSYFSMNTYDMYEIE